MEFLESVLEHIARKETLSGVRLEDTEFLLKQVNQIITEGVSSSSGLRVEDCGPFASNFASPSGDLELTLQGHISAREECLAAFKAKWAASKPGLDNVDVCELNRDLQAELLKVVGAMISQHTGLIRGEATFEDEDLPVMTFQTHAGTAFRMTVGDENAVFRSKVLNQLAWMDARFQKLVRIVQAWGRQQGIVGRGKGLLSPYCITQMVLFHLQNRPTPIIPPICFVFGQLLNSEPEERPQHNGQWANDVLLAEVYQNAVHRLGAKRQNDESLAELLISFFDFYKDAFHKWAAGMDVAHRISTWTAGWEYRAWQQPHHHLVSIEEPLDATRNCADTLDAAGLTLVQQRLREALKEAYLVFEREESEGVEGDFSYLSGFKALFE